MENLKEKLRDISRDMLTEQLKSAGISGEMVPRG